MSVAELKGQYMNSAEIFVLIKLSKHFMKTTKKLSNNDIYCQKLIPPGLNKYINSR